jgi:hypothetical protein
MKLSELLESSDPTKEQKRLEKMVRDALKNGDDYTARRYVKMAPTPEGKKALTKLIQQTMHEVPEGLSEGIEKDLKDAILHNWMTWSVSKIVDHLKLQMKHGKWSELKGKSDEDLEDLVDAAKDAARNHG